MTLLTDSLLVLFSQVRTVSVEKITTFLFPIDNFTLHREKKLHVEFLLFQGIFFAVGWIFLMTRLSRDYEVRKMRRLATIRRRMICVFHVWCLLVFFPDKESSSPGAFLFDIYPICHFVWAIHLRDLGISWQWVSWGQCLFVWSIDWLIDWLTDWLVDRSIDWLNHLDFFANKVNVLFPSGPACFTGRLALFAWL